MTDEVVHGQCAVEENAEAFDITVRSIWVGGRGGGGGELSGKRCGVTDRATDCDTDEKQAETDKGADT